MNIAAPTQNLNRLVQLDRSRGLELKAFDEGGVLHGESELSLSEAAQHLAQGQTVAVEEVSKREIPVSYTQWGHPKEGVLTLTQRMRTHLSSPDDLSQFLQVRSGEKPTTPLEALATRFLEREGHLDQGRQEIASISAVKSGFFGGKKLVDGPGLSAFEAAQCLMHGGTVALTQLPLLVMAEAVIGGGGEELVKEKMKAQYISAESDLDALARKN